MSKPQEPKQDWGFYAVTPRIVRTKYKDLSHSEKWLYTCLKDLCGDKGSCFRSLRSLSEETDISTGSLSKMIPHLHEVGLIHAEKKKRTATGKEIWHITIVDIWQENARDCSKNEQYKEEIVQKMNDVVQKMNEDAGDCSKNERDCSNFVDRRITMKNTNYEEYKDEEESSVSSETTPRPFVASATSTPSLSSQCLSEEMKPKAPSKKKTEEPKGPPVMPPADMEWGTTKCKMMFDAWRGHTLIAQYKIMEASKCAKGLAEQFTEEEVRRVYQAMSEDAYWKERGGPDICNVANNIDKELKKMKSGKVTKQTSSHGTASHDGYTKEERLALYKMTQEERKMYNQKRREARERAMEVQ